MYICVCHAVTDRDIHAARRRGVRTLDELSAETGAGSCCGSCADVAERLLGDDGRCDRPDCCKGAAAA